MATRHAIEPEPVQPLAPAHRIDEHHVLGVFGHLVFPQWNGTASFSPIRIWPTSRPRAFRTAHERP
jgi:hypothetical protein